MTAIIAPPRPCRLMAWRRSRCWKCDGQMSRWTVAQYFCRRCVHLVTYGIPKED